MASGSQRPGLDDGTLKGRPPPYWWVPIAAALAASLQLVGCTKEPFEASQFEAVKGSTPPQVTRWWTVRHTTRATPSGQFSDGRARAFAQGQ
jgi:hypothetical protein